MALLDRSKIKKYLEKYPFRKYLYENCIPVSVCTKSHPNGTLRYKVYICCEDSLCEHKDIVHEVDLDNLANDKCGDGLYRCRYCGQRWSMNHQDLKSRGRKAMDSLLSRDPDGVSKRATLGYSRMSKEDIDAKMKKTNEKAWFTKTENGTWFRSKLEIDIEREFGGQHGDPSFDMDLDNYWPELKCGVEVDDPGHVKYRENYHHEKKEYFDSLGIRVLFISLSPNAVRRPGYKGWRDLVSAHLRGEVPDDQLIMWDDPYHIRG